MRLVEDLRLREHPLVPPPSVVPGSAKKIERTRARLATGIAVGVVDGVAVDVVHMAALARLVAVAPLVVAGRVDQRVLEAGPQVDDLLVVGLGAVLLAGVDVADVQDEIDLRVGVDRSR